MLIITVFKAGLVTVVNVLLSIMGFMSRKGVINYFVSQSKPSENYGAINTIYGASLPHDLSEKLEGKFYLNQLGNRLWVCW